jgi:hypothetical protein
VIAETKSTKSPRGTGDTIINEDLLDDIIVRFLVRLPESEKKPPRLFLNLRNAGWFYLDNYV